MAKFHVQLASSAANTPHHVRFIHESGRQRLILIPPPRAATGHSAAVGGVVLEHSGITARIEAIESARCCGLLHAFYLSCHWRQLA